MKKDLIFPGRFHLFFPVITTICKLLALVDPGPRGAPVVPGALGHHRNYFVC